MTLCLGSLLAQIPTPAVIKFGQTLRPPKLIQVQASERLSSTIGAFLHDWGLKADSKSPSTLKIVMDSKLGSEEYDLKLGRTLSIRAGSQTAAAWGLSTLGQLLTGPRFQSGKIHDKPARAFRGLLLDVARRYHSPSTIRTLIRWCNLGKVRYLILHLTDDQNWMLPTSVLAGVDAHNSHKKPSYTRQELIDLQEFAEARGVSIIPEVDVPGHSSLLTQFDLGLFRIQGADANGCANFGSKAVRSKLKQLLDELCELFPHSPYIHLGGDEAWYPNAEKDPQMAAAITALGSGKNAGDVFVDFLAEMQRYVIAKGKTPIVWEGFPASQFARKMIPKQTLVVAWEGPYYPAKQLVPDGFSVINSGWDPYYVVNHYPYDIDTLVPLERLLNSSPLKFGVVDIKSRPDADFEFQNSQAVKGSLLCWWEGREWNAQTTLPARILAFGSSLWGGSSTPDYKRFLDTFSLLRTKVEASSRPFATRVSGLVVGSESEFEIQASLAFESKLPSLRFAVRPDGQIPTAADLIEGHQFTVDRSCHLVVQAFDGTLPVGEAQFSILNKVAKITSLTTGRPVIILGDRDLQFSAANLVDGISDDPTGYWLAYPCPRWAVVDLGPVRTISRIQVVPVWTNGSPTSYQVEGSVDGKTWKLLVDRSNNKTPSTPAGYEDRIPAMVVRYLRLTALGGELYPTSMARILEFRAFGS